MSASLAPLPPLGGIAPLPLITLAVRPSRPRPRRGAQAALSPSFGALATPLAWQVAQFCVYSAGTAPAVAAAGVAAAAVVTAAGADGFTAALLVGRAVAVAAVAGAGVPLAEAVAGCT